MRCTLQASTPAGAGKAGDKAPRIVVLLSGIGVLPIVWYGSQHAPLQPATTPWLDDALTRWEKFSGVSLGWLKCHDQATVRRRFLTYSACLLSMLGGVHWGLAMTAATPAAAAGQYVMAVLPGLAGWLALNLDASTVMPHTVMAMAFLGIYFYDEAMLLRRALPPWYTFVRTPTTLVAVLSTTIGAYMARRTKERRL